MSQVRWWLTCILGVIALVLTGWNLHDSDEIITTMAIDGNEPTYQSQHTVTLVYNPEGKLDYKVAADAVNYYTSNEQTWFTRPVMTLFDSNTAPSWSVRADRAKLTQDKMLHLYGNVKVNSLTAASQLQKLDTNSAQVNLVNQDVSSDDIVRLSGTGTISSGMKMRGNLRSRKAELIEEVNTYYEIQNSK
jgi:lipopolysaccharide export system protein LptC